MTDERPPDTPMGPRPEQSPPTWGPKMRVDLLSDHFTRHARSHTPEALGRAAVEAGYTQEEVAAAIASVEARLTAAEASAPKRSIAQRVILAAYLLTYIAFGIVFLGRPFSYGAGAIAFTILTLVLGLALLLSVLWARRRTWKDQGTGLSFASILAVPFVLLVLVAGSCIWTTYPMINPTT